MLLPLLMLLFHQPAVAKQPQLGPITPAQAEELVKRAVGPKVDVVIERNEQTHEYWPDFYYFDISLTHPCDTCSFVWGFMAVDPRTGDIWDSVVCQEYKSREVRRYQKELRKQLGMDQAEYHRWRRKGPMCD